MCLRFLKILFQTGDIVFVLCGVLLSAYVKLKSYLSGAKKTSAVKSETHEKLSKIIEAIEN